MSIVRFGWLFAICAVFLPLHSSLAEYSPRDFFTNAPAELFYTEDEMSEEDKAAVVKKGFKKAKDFECTAWGVASESKDALTLKYCEDSDVTVRVFPIKDSPKQPLVVVQSSRSSGRAVHLEWFKVSQGAESFKPLTEEQLKQFGLERPQPSDFMAKGNALPEGAPPLVKMELDEEGRVSSFIHTWMEPQWEHKQPDFSFLFIWGGARFTRQPEKN
jgi:hypothetical protein